jgi:hypothetical protein
MIIWSRVRIIIRGSSKGKAKMSRGRRKRILRKSGRVRRIIKKKKGKEKIEKKGR